MTNMRDHDTDYGIATVEVRAVNQAGVLLTAASACACRQEEADVTVDRCCPRSGKPSGPEHFGRSPERFDIEDIRAFQVHLAGTGISRPRSTRSCAR